MPLDVNAGVNNYYGILESTSPVSESSQNVSLTINIEPTQEYLDISGGTYSGSSTGTYSGSGTGSVSQSGTASPNDAHWYGGVGGSIVQSGSVTMSGTEYNGRISMSGSWTGNTSSFTSSTMYIDPKSYSISSSGSMSSTDTGTSASTNSGSISLTSTHGGSLNCHYRIPLFVLMPFVTGGSIDPNKYYGFFCSVQNLTLTGEQLTITNFCLTLADGTLLLLGDTSTNSRNCYYFMGSEILGNSSSRIDVPIFIEFDAFKSSLSTASQGTISFDIFPRFRKVLDSAQDSVGNIQSDPIQHQLQQENNEITEDTNETTHSIFDSITDFFGSFFSNLIGVFVPDSGYFENWFSRVDTMLSNKLGILYWPFSKIIAFFNRLSDSVSSQSNVTITFPAIEFTNIATGETYHFLDAQSVNLEYYNYRIPLTGGSPNSDLVGSNRFNSLVSIVRTFNSAVLIFGLLALLRKKLNYIIRGSDDDN